MSKRDGDFKESWSGGEPSNYKGWKSLGLTNKERGQVLRGRLERKLIVRGERGNPKHKYGKRLLRGDMASIPLA